AKVVAEKVDNTALVTQVIEVVPIGRQWFVILAECIGNPLQDVFGGVQVKHEEIVRVGQFVEFGRHPRTQCVRRTVRAEHDTVCSGDKARIEIVVEVVRKASHAIATCAQQEEVVASFKIRTDHRQSAVVREIETSDITKPVEFTRQP